MLVSLDSGMQAGNEAIDGVEIIVEDKGAPGSCIKLRCSGNLSVNQPGRRRTRHCGAGGTSNKGS